MDKAKIYAKLRDRRWYIERNLKIKTKDARIAPLRLNAPQKRLLDALEKQDAEGKPMRVIILKARQMGFSTVTEAVIFHEAATRRNVNAMIVAHRDDSTKNLFGMSRRYYDNLPEPLKPMRRASNAQELLFDNPDRNEARRARNPGLHSRIRCQTAGGGGIGRSDTIQMAHLSEFAFWPGEKNDTLVGILQAVPSERGTLVVIESTANGYDAFHELWERAVRGESGFLPLFFPWFEMEEYRKPVPPGTVWTGKEQELARRFGLDEEQLAWRRWCIANNCGGDEDKFRQEYPSYPEEAFLTSGRPVFDMDAVAARLQEELTPLRTGEFVFDPDPGDRLKLRRIRWTDKPDGCVKIYEAPVKGRPYVIGGDTAGTGSDWFTGQVIDNASGRQAAVLRHQYDEDIYARQMYCLGRYYNWALLGIEVNYSTYPVKLLDLLGYPRLYVRQIPDTYKTKFREAFGWETNSRTRPLAIAGLVQAFRDDPEMVRDRETLKEMKVFAYNDDHRPEALPGEHDDLVMALAIAAAIRDQQRAEPERGKEPSTKHWTRDMWEDYSRADAATKKHLMEIWGKHDAEREDGPLEGAAVEE